MLNFNSVLLFSEDPKRLTKFYEEVFDKKVDWDEYGYFGFQIGNTNLTIGPHDKVTGSNKQPERLMINFETDEVEKEFERIEKIKGVKVIAKPYSMDESNEPQIATFADPDGNFFQLMIPFDIDITKN